MTLNIRIEKRWNEDDEDDERREQVKTSARKEEKEKKLDCLCVLKLEPINQVLIIELVKLSVLI